MAYPTFVSQSLVAALSLLLATGASTASADTGNLVAVGGELTCAEIVPCSPVDYSCPDRLECGIIGTRGELGCHFLGDSYHCCDSDADCFIESMDRNMAIGRCIATPSLPEVPGVCEYEENDTGDPLAPSFCFREGVPPESWILPCLTRPEDGMSAESWGEGDCDGDGVSNGVEWYGPQCSPCDPGEVPDESGGCRMNAMPDAGSDAGPPFDGSTPDASMDAEVDATPAPGPTPVASFRGGSGCTCNASGDALPLPVAVVLFWVFSMGAVRRRRW